MLKKYIYVKVQVGILGLYQYTMLNSDYLFQGNNDSFTKSLFDSPQPDELVRSSAVSPWAGPLQQDSACLTLQGMGGIMPPPVTYC